LIHGLGGTIVAATEYDPHAVPADVSFGDGPPVLPSAPSGSAARSLLDRHLSAFLLDARRAMQLSGRAERLAEDASTDVLTGLPNRRSVTRALGRLVERDLVIILDLDHFKRVNDDLGHAAGDEVLRAFGSVLRSTVRGRDVVGRFGGEEFMVVLIDAPDADAFLHRLRAAWIDARPYPVTFSAGIARSTGQTDTTVALADAALYRAKAAGRDRWMWSKDADSEAVDSKHADNEQADVATIEHVP
jgi:diguanylate cyclase (GGDEF)-like protein